MHVLTPAVFDLIGDQVARRSRRGSIQLTTAERPGRRRRYLALETRGTRHNLGVKYGVVEAQIALALAGVDRERMLAGLLESVVGSASGRRTDRLRPSADCRGARGLEGNPGSPAAN
ncbi:MAG: hypothetical protein WKF75_18470 [Singulisphaera sp.]